MNTTKQLKIVENTLPPFEALTSLPCHTVEDFRLYRLGIFNSDENGYGTSIDLVELSTDKSYPEHYHKNSDANFYIVKGTGMFLLNGVRFPYQKNQHYYVPRGMWHGFLPDESTLFISIQNPQIKNPQTGMEDIQFE